MLVENVFHSLEIFGGQFFQSGVYTRELCNGVSEETPFFVIVGSLSGYAPEIVLYKGYRIFCLCQFRVKPADELLVKSVQRQFEDLALVTKVVIHATLAHAHCCK